MGGAARLLMTFRYPCLDEGLAGVDRAYGFIVKAPAVLK